MALIKCIECGADVSDKAVACPKCGHPVAFTTPTVERDYVYVPPPYDERARMLPPGETKKGGWHKWVLIVPAALFGLVMCIGSISDPDGKLAARDFEKRKHECTEALMSSIGHSTVGYADKAAYDTKVKEKCAGLSIDGKPLGQ